MTDTPDQSSPLAPPSCAAGRGAAQFLPGFEPGLSVGVGHDGDGDCWFTPGHVLSAVDGLFGAKQWGDPCHDARAPASKRVAWSIDVRAGGDGLVDPWGSRAFVNPPFSNTAAWLARCASEASQGVEIVGLFQNRTEGIAWHDYVFDGGADLVVPRGRLKFVGLDGATSGSAKVGTVFACWNCDPFKFSLCLKNSGIQNRVLIVERLPW